MKKWLQCCGCLIGIGFLVSLLHAEQKEPSKDQVEVQRWIKILEQRHADLGSYKAVYDLTTSKKDMTGNVTLLRRCSEGQFDEWFFDFRGKDGESQFQNVMSLCREQGKTYMTVTMPPDRIIYADIGSYLDTMEALNFTFEPDADEKKRLSIRVVLGLDKENLLFMASLVTNPESGDGCPWLGSEILGDCERVEISDGIVTFHCKDQYKVMVKEKDGIMIRQHCPQKNNQLRGMKLRSFELVTKEVSDIYPKIDFKNGKMTDAASLGLSLELLYRLCFQTKVALILAMEKLKEEVDPQDQLGDVLPLDKEQVYQSMILLNKHMLMNDKKVDAYLKKLPHLKKLIYQSFLNAKGKAPQGGKVMSYLQYLQALDEDSKKSWLQWLSENSASTQAAALAYYQSTERDDILLEGLEDDVKVRAQLLLKNTREKCQKESIAMFYQVVLDSCIKSEIKAEGGE